MSFSIRTNVGSLNAQKNLFNSSSMLQDSFSKLSSGFRITKAGDDAAGLGISVNLNAQIRSFNQGNRNAQDAQSLIQTAESNLNQTTELLTRMRELAMQSASSGVGNTERGYIQTENTALITEIDRIANAAEYNGQALLNSAATSLTFQVGIRNVAANDRISVSTVDATSATLAVSTLDFSTQAASQTALATIDTALQTISSARATFGAAGNRLTSVIQTIQGSAESLSAANSRIRDVDVAEETSKMARTQVMMQAGVSVLAQANQAPQIALKLLG
ncbi:MAG: flagellin [Archangium sp.]|nr:flagellin [Archangium sp.]MDP3157979.1 flagellin [Archangium sp.]MDP3574893.1 flagellin [Archangium sp.]